MATIAPLPIHPDLVSSADGLPYLVPQPLTWPQQPMTSVMSQHYIPPVPHNGDSTQYHGSGYAPGYDMLPGQLLTGTDAAGGHGPVAHQGRDLPRRPAPLKVTKTTPRFEGLTSLPLDDKRRNKLNYLRAPVACRHCRRRKIRCKPGEKDVLNRCFSCSRLDKECIFGPVSEEGPLDHKKITKASAPSHEGKARPGIGRPPTLTKARSMPMALRSVPPPPSVSSPVDMLPSSQAFSPEPNMSEPSPSVTYDYLPQSVPNPMPEPHSAHDSGEIHAGMGVGYPPEQALSPLSQAAPGLHEPPSWALPGEYPRADGLGYSLAPQDSSFSGGEVAAMYPVRQEGRSSVPSELFPPMMSPTHDGVSLPPIDPSLLPPSVPYGGWLPPIPPRQQPYTYPRNSIDSNHGWYVDQGPPGVMNNETAIMSVAPDRSVGRGNLYYGPR